MIEADDSNRGCRGSGYIANRETEDIRILWQTMIKRREERQRILWQTEIETGGRRLRHISSHLTTVQTGDTDMCHKIGYLDTDMYIVHGEPKLKCVETEEKQQTYFGKQR